MAVRIAGNVNHWAGVLIACCTTVIPFLGMEIIAHRGDSDGAPENTLASMKLGYERNADAGELDIRLTKDGGIVVIHDPDTYRVTGVSNQIAASTVAVLRGLEAGQWGKWKDQGFSERIPLLEEVLPLVPEGKRLFIEIKCGPEVLPELKRVLRASRGTPEQWVLIGFDYETMRQAKQELPEVQAYWLGGADNKTHEYLPLEPLIAKARAAGLNGLNLEKGFPVDKEFTRKVHEAGLKLYTWTVDDANVARRQMEAGVDGITTNRPKWLREQCGL